MPFSIKKLNLKLPAVSMKVPLFLLLLVGILLLLFQYSIVISMHHERILRLTQEIALLKEKLNRTEKTNEPSDQ